MREIKFRVWLEEMQKMYYNIGILNNDLNVNLDGYGYDFLGDYRHFNVMQYTGLVDVGEVEIYEGDILYNYSNNNYYEVLWDDTSAQFLFNCPDKKYADGYFDLDEENEWTHLVVWGNRYEHPHLLEVK